MQDSLTTTTQHIVDQGLERLDALAAKLNIAVESIWVTLVQQAPIVAVQDALHFLLAITLTFLLFLFFRTMMRLRDTAVEGCDRSREELTTTGAIVSAILGVCCFAWSAVGAGLLTLLPTKLLNPEYWALLEVMRIIQ